MPKVEACEKPPADATVVILTGGATGSARSAREVWRLDQETFRRIGYGLELARRAPGAEVLVSGGAEVGLTNEARIAEQLVMQMGWPASRLRIEDASRDTYTSARDVAPMLRAGAPLVLVTSSLHLRRAAYVYRKSGMRPLPCGVPPLDALILPDSLIPSGEAFAHSSQALKEILGLWVYKLRAAPLDADR
ncbi:MAG: YdcF family protein [Steroidobacteraceae bacterium]